MLLEGSIFFPQANSWPGKEQQKTSNKPINYGFPVDFPRILPETFGKNRHHLVLWRRSLRFFFLRICAFANNQYAIEHALGDFRLRMDLWLVGGLEHFVFSHILGIIIPIDVHIFQRGWHHQPDGFTMGFPGGFLSPIAGWWSSMALGNPVFQMISLGVPPWNGKLLRRFKRESVHPWSNFHQLTNLAC